MSAFDRLKNHWKRVTWRRVRLPVEERVGPVEQRLNATAARLDAVAADLERLGERLRLLEAAWQQHSPILLNAAATVPALAHELLVQRRSTVSEIAEIRMEMRGQGKTGAAQ